MTTPRTGRPLGRPRKHPVIVGPKLAPHRPRKPLSQASDRYQLAYFEAHVRGGALHKISETRILESLIARENLFCKINGRRVAYIVNTPANIDAFRQGKKFQVAMDAEMAKGLLPVEILDCPNASQKGWRNENSFRPLIDRMRSRLARLRAGRSDDVAWLRAMSIAWYRLLAEARIDDARRLAGSVGEQSYFEQVMLPEALRREAV